MKTDKTPITNKAIQGVVKAPNPLASGVNRKLKDITESNAATSTPPSIAPTTVPGTELSTLETTNKATTVETEERSKYEGINIANQQVASTTQGTSIASTSVETESSGERNIERTDNAFGNDKVSLKTGNAPEPPETKEDEADDPLLASSPWEGLDGTQKA